MLELILSNMFHYQLHIYKLKDLSVKMVIFLPSDHTSSTVCISFRSIILVGINHPIVSIGRAGLDRSPPKETFSVRSCFIDSYSDKDIEQYNPIEKGFTLDHNRFHRSSEGKDNLPEIPSSFMYSSNHSRIVPITSQPQIIDTTILYRHTYTIFVNKCKTRQEDLSGTIRVACISQ